MKYAHSSVVVLALLLGNSYSASAQGEITFLAPQPLKASLDTLIPGFESKTRYKAKMTVGTGLEN